MLDHFINSENPAQILIVLAVFTICWHAVWNRKNQKQEYRSLHIEKINFFLLLWLVCTLGSFTYSLIVPVWPIVIVAVGSLCWDLAALAILIIRPGARLVRILAAMPLVAVVLLSPIYNYQMKALVADIDRVLICGPDVKLDKCPLAANTAGIEQDAAQNKGAPVNQEWGGVRVKPSSVARGIYFFLTLFLVLSYYGEVYRLWHERRVEQISTWALDTSVINNLAMILSFSVAMIGGLFFAGADLPSLGIFSGLLAAGVSIALRDVLQNSIAGMLLIWDKTIKKDDVITINGNQYGWVDRITLRYTLIKDRNDINSLIPNSTLISGTIQNWTQGKSNVRLKLDIGVAYSTKVSDAITRLSQAARRVKRVLKNPPPLALVMGMGDSAINLQLRFWIDDPKNGIRNVLSQVYLEVLDEFSREEPKKIDIPFPQREIRVIGNPQPNSEDVFARHDHSSTESHMMRDAKGRFRRLVRSNPSPSGGENETGSPSVRKRG